MDKILSYYSLTIVDNIVPHVSQIFLKVYRIIIFVLNNLIIFIIIGKESNRTYITYVGSRVQCDQSELRRSGTIFT